jgi:hypothetical protein
MGWHSLFDSLFSKKREIPNAHERIRLVKVLAARMNSGSDEAQRVGADRWANKMLQNRQFHMLAAMSAVRNRETFYLTHYAKVALRKAGAQAVDAIIDQLRDDLDPLLVEILIEIGDEKAVPVLKGCLSGNYAYRLSEYGIQSDVEKFIAKFD